MGRPRPPQLVKLFAGLLSGDLDLLRRARQLLVRRFGPVDVEGVTWPFDLTDYYEAEMGPGLQRTFIGFERLIRPDELAAIKRAANLIEEEIGTQCLLPEIPRPVNIDPGYIDLNKLVLASTKDSGHRVYIGERIYAEITLLYARGGWQPLPWTYPDFAAERYHPWFTNLRERLRSQRAASPLGAADAGVERL